MHTTSFTGGFDLSLLWVDDIFCAGYNGHILALEGSHMDTVGSRLKALRATTGLSQQALADIAGTKQSTVNRYENDASEMPLSIRGTPAVDCLISTENLSG